MSCYGPSPDGIYALLSALGKPGEWQWMLYLPSASENGSGCLLRIKPYGRGFVFSPKDYRLTTDTPTVAVVRIGSRPHGLHAQHLIDALAPMPLRAAGDVYCTWFFDAVARLHAQRYLKCPSLSALEQELTASGYLGEEYRRKGVAPWCERTSTKCW